MSYRLFLLYFGHLPNPSIEQAYYVYEFDEAPDTFKEAMQWYHLSRSLDMGHEWCAVMWRAKCAWSAYMKRHKFPIPETSEAVRLS